MKEKVKAKDGTGMGSDEVLMMTKPAWLYGRGNVSGSGANSFDNVGSGMSDGAVDVAVESGRLADR